jgi:mannose-1-phosphate guanylyltransferase
LIKEFIEKPIIELEYPEAAGIYIFNNGFLDLLKQKSNEKESFGLSSDILSKIGHNTKSKLYCYLIDSNEINWADIESPTYVERNKRSTALFYIWNQLNKIYTRIFSIFI